ncbi:MAG: calcium-binding protein [Rhizobiaceae bacterium]|nr:calcium-binding protein [Rhizobiaceae bacterium]
MAMLFPQSITSAGITVNLGTVDSVFVARDVFIASTANRAISGTGSNHKVWIDGVVASKDYLTVNLGDLGSVDNANLVEIGSSGQVRQFGNTAGVSFYSFNSTLKNAGLISAPGGYGVWVLGENPATTSTIINSGTITSSNYSVDVYSTETVVLNNSGTIVSSTRSYSSSNTSVDKITNTGLMVGDIYLGVGKDSYNGAGGRVTGWVYGQAGEDTITGGSENNWFNGGSENDTLRGNGGHDTLLGEAGSDTLSGGLGRDMLWGGLGGDHFIFDAPVLAASRDTIYDFSRAQGDKIHLDNAFLKKVGANGSLKAAAFTLGKKAADAADRIIYDKATGKLFYDSDGSGAAAQIHFATLANKVALSQVDFKVI